MADDDHPNSVEGHVPAGSFNRGLANGMCSRIIDFCNEWLNIAAAYCVVIGDSFYPVRRNKHISPGHTAG